MSTLAPSADMEQTCLQQAFALYFAANNSFADLHVNKRLRYGPHKSFQAPVDRHASIPTSAPLLARPEVSPLRPREAPGCGPSWAKSVSHKGLAHSMDLGAGAAQAKEPLIQRYHKGLIGG